MSGKGTHLGASESCCPCHEGKRLIQVHPYLNNGFALRENVREGPMSGPYS